MHLLHTSSSWTFSLCTLLWGKNKTYIQWTSDPQPQLFCCTLLFECKSTYRLIDIIFLWCKIMCILKLPKYDSQWENSGTLSQICLSLSHSVFYVIRRFCWKNKYMCMCVYVCIFPGYIFPACFWYYSYTFTLQKHESYSIPSLNLASFI